MYFNFRTSDVIQSGRYYILFINCFARTHQVLMAQVKLSLRTLWYFLLVLQFWHLSIKTATRSFSDNKIRVRSGPQCRKWLFSVQTSDREVLVVRVRASRSKRRTPGQKSPSWEPRHQRHVVFSQIWSSANGLPEYSEGGEQRIFCYLTVLLGETDHNSGRSGEQQTVHISSPLQHAPGPD